MKLIFAVLLCVLFSNASISHAAVGAGPGPAPDGAAIAEYDPATGEIAVSVTNIVNWFINSASSGLSGPDDASSILPLAGGTVGDNDSNIGESSFSSFSYTDAFLGEVALPNLPVGDLNITWVPFFGGGSFSQPVAYLGLPVPEPASLALAALALLGIGYFRRYRI